MAEEKDQYKCKSCGSTAPESEEGGGCCGQSREKVCTCGSGKYAKECCAA